MKAVKVGYYFNLFEEQEVSHISLEPTGSRVCVDGTIYPVYRGRTAEESKKIDLLLNEIGDLPLKDYRVKEKEMER